MVKSEKSETFCVSKLPIWRQKWVAGIRHGNSLVVCWMLPGRVIAVLFWTKYAVPRQIKPAILRLSIRRGQSNFTMVFIFVSFEEKGYYRKWCQKKKAASCLLCFSIFISVNEIPFLLDKQDTDSKFVKLFIICKWSNTYISHSFWATTCIVIPPNSNKFSDWRSTCPVSWVKTH